MGQPQTQKPIKVAPKLETTKPLDPGIAGTGGLINKGEVIGERYRLTMSFAPDDINDEGPNSADHIYDVYGTLKINGETWWEMPRKTSNKGMQQMGGYFVPNNETYKAKYGYSLTKPNACNAGRDFEFDAFKGDPRSILKLSLKLYDADTPPQSTDRSKDDTFGSYDLDLDLLKMGVGDYWWFWKDGNGNDSRFFVHVDHVKSLYGKAGTLPKVDIPPVIVKPRFPGKGPGPVIKTAPLRR
jgi:hypothetical protein